MKSPPMAECVLSARLARPFLPFTIRLVDGRAERIDEPECVAIAPNLVVVVRRDNSSLHIDPSSIVSLEFEPDARR